MKYLIVFDCGATKTDCALADINGNILYTTTGGAANFLVSGTEGTSGIIMSLLNDCIKKFNTDYFETLDFRFLALPYGVVLFALWGSALIPEIKEMLVRSGLKEVRKTLRRVILWGIIISAVIYLFFIFRFFSE